MSEDSYYEIEVTFHEGTRTPLYEYKRLVDREPLPRGEYLTADERDKQRESDHGYLKHPVKEEVSHERQVMYTQKVGELDIVAVIAAINKPRDKVVGASGLTQDTGGQVGR